MSDRGAYTEHTSAGLLALSSELNQAGSIEDASAVAVRTLDHNFDAPLSAIWEFDETRDEFRPTAESTETRAAIGDPPTLPCDSLVGRVYRQHRSEVFDDVHETADRYNPETPIRSELLVPISDFGVLSVGATEPDAFTGNDTELVKLVASNLEAAVSRIRRREELQAERNWTHTLFEGSNDAIFISDSDASVVQVNQAACELTGYEREKLRSMRIPDLYEGADLRAYQDSHDEISAGSKATTTVKLRRSDDSTVDVELSNRRIERDGTGYLYTVARDVTEDRERRRRLESFKSAVENTSEGIAILEDEKYTYVDRVHAEMYGFADQNELLGQTWRELYTDSAEAKRIESEAIPALQSDGEWSGTVTASPDGREEFPTELSLTRLEGDRIVCVARNVSEKHQRREKIRQNERRFESVFEDPEMLVGVLATDGRTIDVNQTALEYVSNDKSDILGEPFWEGEWWAHSPDLQDDLTDWIERAAGGEYVSYQAKHPNQDGDMRFITGTIRPVTGDAGVESLVVSGRDITPRERRHRELETFQQAVEDAKDGFAILEDGEYTYVDETHVDMYGFDETGEFLGNSWRMLYNEEETERLESDVFPVLESEGHWRGEVTGSRRDGTAFPVELSLTIVDDGRLVCIVRDETERRARERELELKERAMDEASVGIQITDPTRENNPLVYVNDGFERITGYDREEVIGRNPRFLQGEDTDAEHQTRLRDAIDAEKPVSLELRNRRKDGTQYWSRLSITPVTGETGTVENFIGIQQDVTERKQREQRKDATVDVLERVYAVTTDPELSFDEKVDGLLAAGTEYLDLPYGFVTQIEAGDEDAPGAQTIVEAHGDHDLLQPGESCLLPESYCRKAIGNDGPLTVTNAGQDGWEDDPAYERFDLETYIGGVIEVDEDTYGTLCFASSTQRERRFDETERSFLNLFRQWIGYEIERETARNDLREQRERLELVLSGTDTGIAEWDLQTDEVGWNETLVELTGRDVTSAEEFEAAVHPADRERVRERLEESIRTGEPWVGEFRMIDAAGDVLWIGSRAVPTHDDDGEPVRLLATGTDISERKRDQAERRRNERRYRTLAENIPNGAVLMFDESLRYNLAAGKLLSEFGLDQSDVIGRRFGELLPDADIDSELATQFHAAIDGERTERRIELRDHTLRFHLVPVDDGDERSTSRRGLLLAQDITDEARRERALFEERERLRLLTESVDEYAFFIVGADGAIQTWNEGVESTFAYDAERWLDTQMSMLYPAADRDRGLPKRLLQQARVAGESTHEGWLVRADGSEFYAEIKHAALTDDDGAFRGYAAVVRDMTERRRQRRRTERFLEESIDVVTVVDTDGEVTYVSGSADRVVGYKPDELTGTNLFDRFHPDSREEVMEAFFDSCEHTDGDSWIEGRFESSDGEWLNVKGQCRNMLDDDAIDGMLMYLRDVTDETKRARRFESIFNQTYQFTGLLQPDGTVIEVNDAALEFGGIERDDTVGEQFGDLPWWTHSETVGDELRDALDRAASGEFVRYETTVRGANGLATIDFSAKPVTDEDGTVSLLVVEGRDVTAREQHRRHLEVMQRVVRHNIRNDLTKVRGWAGLMCDEDDAETRSEQFARVERVLDKWEAMSERMKQIRTLLESETRLRPTADPESILDDAVAPVRDEGADVAVSVDAPDTASVRVPPALRDAVRELVENASNATEHGTVEVELACSDDDWVEITVSDDGPGLPEMEADVLATGEETPLNHGQGLGLWMVRMVVTEAGGDVSVDSAGDGTTVCLRLPTDRSDETSTPGPAA